MAEKPLCFVLMPFGKKKDPSGGPDIDFDAIYETAIRPGIEDAEIEPIRADEERSGGIIHKAMFERLLLCDFAVADLTTGNPNVFYEIGVRHAARPATTLAIFAGGKTPPFDVGFLRALPYEIGAANAFGAAEAAKLRTGLAKRLGELRDVAGKDAVVDSPVFQLIDGYRPQDPQELDHEKTDTFRERSRYSQKQRAELAAARRARDVSALDAFEKRLGARLDGVEVGVLVDLYLSWRAVEQWQRMLDLHDRFPRALQQSALVREQRGFALNRLGRRDEAIDVLEEIIRSRGASPETNGILGRVYKDRFLSATKAEDEFLAAGYLDKAIDTYVRGFEADTRDAYPGVNAVTLLDVRGDTDSLRRKDELLPLVRYAVSLKMKRTEPDYWDHATLVELAVLADDAAAARRHLTNAVSNIREAWEPKTTANNLALIRDARAKRGVVAPWVDSVIETLKQRGA